MNLSELTSISPIDGRYRGKTKVLATYFSEYALIRYRVMVEVEYFIALCEWPLPQLEEVNKATYPAIRAIYEQFREADALAIKQTEATINHDVKAVEYFIKGKMEQMGLGAYKEWVHFGLTSQDINNTAVPVSLRAFRDELYLPTLQQLVNTLRQMGHLWKGVPMLARTHGQPASPTSVGKELLVFVDRLEAQLAMLSQCPVSGKFGGATGNFNAHLAAFPDIDWTTFGNRFLKQYLHIDRQAITTQIEHYDHLAAFFDTAKRINNILIDLSRDVWTYISLEYFKQRVNPNEVGSSAMPHKVNPIDFENAEGNLGVANALLEHLSAKLPISRLQRDLTDSTVLRNIGVPFAHTLIATQALQKGLDKLSINQTAIQHDLERNWMVVAEAIQTVLRAKGIDNPYELLKALTRKGEAVGKADMDNFVDNLPVDEATKSLLKAFSPHTYTGTSTHE